MIEFITTIIISLITHANMPTGTTLVRIYSAYF